MVIKAYCFGATRTELFHSSLTGTSLDSSMGLKKNVCVRKRERGAEKTKQINAPLSMIQWNNYGL